MKKFLISAILPLFFIFLSAFPTFSPRSRANADFPISASAETASAPAAGDYACVLSDSAFFYAAADERRGVFLLPKTYYVRLVDYQSDFCKIEYQRDDGAAKRLVGYAKTEQLAFVDYVPTRPYLYYTFDVSYTIGDAPSDSSFLTEITVSCVYYGDYRIGSETYCYVLRGDEFGYIPKPSGISYEANTEYADHLTSQIVQPEPEEETSAAEGKTSPVQIAILIVICLLVPVLAALVLKPPRRPPYEQEDVN